MTKPILATSALCLALAACATQQSGSIPDAAIVEPAPRLLLLGEVHDNAEGHRLRFEHLRARADGDAPVAIAMEQFDREHQDELDAAMASCADAACVIAAAAPGKSSWNWEYYAPVVQYALDHDLPLVAANLSRAEAPAVAKGGFEAALSPELREAYHLDQPLPEALLAAQVQAVRDGHCNMLPESMLEPMARAQIARDVVMAEAMLGALPSDAAPGAAAGVVFLLAGNGHVNRDIGAPYWLIARGTGEQLVATGYVEEGDDDAHARFDTVHQVPPAERDDPCAAFKAPNAG